jgi:16S rRNA (adenine1518-N6/adenine1519-N6)-dimethyltransferase
MSNPYLSPTYVRATLRSLGLRPTRSMGQNFLVDPHILRQIVQAAELAPDNVVIEVGPGLGVLTWELLQQAGHVIAVELDQQLAARLHNEHSTPGTLPNAIALQIIQGDVLNLPPADLLQQADALSPYKVVANLPYAITSPVLRHFLENMPRPQLMVVLVQWEVARRISAAPGDLSLLAHAIQMYAQPEIVARVPANSFVPSPAVDSAILRLHIRPAPAVAVPDINDFFRILKAGFSQPRKKLSNSLPGGLKALGEPLPRDEVIAALQAVDVNPDRRAETVSLDEWARVYHVLRQISS